MLVKNDRIEGIKDYLSRTGWGLSVSEIHTEVFDGNGSKSYMRNLADEVAASEGFTFRKTPGGKKVLRATGAGTGNGSATTATDGASATSEAAGTCEGRIGGARDRPRRPGLPRL